MAKIQLLSTILTVVLLILFVVQSAAHACSFMQVVAQDGTRVTSRSMEFGVDLKPNWTVIPRGREFVSPAPEGRRGMSWKTKHGTLAAFNFGDNTMAIDGMNEKGLVVSGLSLFVAKAKLCERASNQANRNACGDRCCRLAPELNDSQQIDALKKPFGFLQQPFVGGSSAQHFITDHLKKSTTCAFEVLVKPRIEGDHHVRILVGVYVDVQPCRDHAYQ